MKRNIGCVPLDHTISRRRFLAGTAAGVGVGLSGVLSHGANAKLQRNQKQVLQIFLAGGVSQFESFDPKPGTVHGGPFRAIDTSVPGIQVCELLPHTAKIMHLISLVRSVNLKTDDHAQGTLFMEKGRRAGDYPWIGSVASKYLAPENSPLPGYIHITERGGGGNTTGFLEAKHAQLRLEKGEAPSNLVRPEALTEQGEGRRNQLRLKLNDRFSQRRHKAEVDIYDAAYDQAAQLMQRKTLFETDPSAEDLARYGKHDFGRYCLLARTLLEAGATCVKVSHREYDTHAENFNFHVEQLAEFDKTFATLMLDLHDRGMLEHTLVMVYTEFGRTPRINVRYGRDHWGRSFSVAVGGCGINPGMVVGKTNDKGTEVADREVDGGHLFHTYLQALGLDSTADHAIPGRIIPIGDPAAESIKELLA